MQVSPLIWTLTFGLFAAILLFEYLVHVRPGGTPSVRSAATWSLVYLIGALVFAGFVWASWGQEHAVQYVTGYVTERALSLDNIFVFFLIMAAFAVPAASEELVMLVGVGIAIVLRGIFILMGAAIIERFSAVFFIFGAFLLYTGWKLIQAGPEEDEEYHENAFIRAVKRVVRVTTAYEGQRIVSRVNGRFALTPLALVMLAIGSTDLLFALDSIPAVFGITEEPYIVFVANAWDLVAMIQLYFLLGGLLKRLVYLSYGLAAIMVLIGVKLIIHALRTNALPFLNHGHPITAIPDIPTPVSLVLIVLAFAIAAWFSFQKTAGVDDGAGLSG